MYPRLLCLSVDGKLAAVLRALAEAATHWLALAPLDLDIYEDDDDNDYDDELLDDNQVLIDDSVVRPGTYLCSGMASAKSDIDTDADVDGQMEMDELGLGIGILDSEVADGDEELVRDVLRVIERDLEMAANISRLIEEDEMAANISRLIEEDDGGQGQNRTTVTGLGRKDRSNITDVVNEDGFEPEEDLNSEPPAMDAMVADHALSRRRDPVRTMVSIRHN